MKIICPLRYSLFEELIKFKLFSLSEKFFAILNLPKCIQMIYIYYNIIKIERYILQGDHVMHRKSPPSKHFFREHKVWF